MPLTQGGVVRYWLPDGTRSSCRLTRIHLEEDTGKSTHAGSADGRIAGSTYSLVDFNRAGVPLMECVSEPDIRSADEAVGYLEALKRTFVELGISDVKMEEGSLRCDANVSVRLRGTTAYGTKAEIKNMNSFRSVHRAIESEIERQIAIIESGGRVIQETRGWDEAAGETHSMRSKEQAHDYRYFPDPDLVPLEIEPERVERIRAAMPPLPYDRFVRYVDEWGIGIAQATQLADNAPVAAYFDRVAELSRAPQATLNFVLGDLSRLANESGVGIGDGKVTPEALAELIALSEAKTINSKIAKDVITRLWAQGGSAKAIVEGEGLAQVSDPGAVTGFIDQVLAANADAVASYRAGKENALKFLVGAVMKASRGKANPQLVEQLLREKLAGT
jgi:aspartyl-tRNA(Asn)/glutamyl-tRNA(Gln) amidotransferase subunit B